MIFLLFISLLFILLSDFLFRRFDILRPTTWVTLGFMLGSLFGMFNFGVWGDISLNTVIIILLSVILFNVFSYVGESVKFPGIYNSMQISKHFSGIFVSIMNLVMLFTGFLYLNFMYKNALLGGSSGEWNAIFSYARLAEQMGRASNPSLLLSILLTISFSFGYIQTYIVIRDVVYRKIRGVRFNDFMSVILYFTHTLLSGGRTRMMYFIIFIIVVGLVLYRNKNRWSKKSINVGLKYILFGFGIVVLTFWIIEQTVRGSVYGNSYSLWYQISKYIGSPIYALDIYLGNPSYMRNFTETETMYSIISVLNKLGMSIPFTNNALEFVSFADGSNLVVTNIYTAIRRYVHDFRLPGLIILIIFQSLLYSSFYSSIKKHHIDNLSLLFYGIVVYPVAFYFIEERFINDLFTLTMLFQYFLIIIFVYILKRKGISYNKNQLEEG